MGVRRPSASPNPDLLPGLRPGTTILGERVRCVLLQTPSAVLVTIVNSALMTAILVGAEGNRHAYVWLAAVLVVAASRLGMWWGFLRVSPPDTRIRPWAIALTCGSFAAGSLWGAGAVLLVPHAPTYQLFWIFVIGGMCAGAAALHAMHLPTVLAFIVPASLPTMIRYALTGSAVGGAQAAMIVVFVTALAVSSIRSSRQFGDLLQLQMALARRTRDLDESHASLQREVAEHSATEASLRHAQKMEAMGQLTGGIAHDFNNLLTALLGSLDALRNRVPATDERAIRLLDNAVRGARRGSVLTQRLLAFGRRQALNPEIVDLPELIRGMAELLHTSIGSGIEIATQFPIDLAPAHVDANQLELALLNLAVNARDAMRGHGGLTISAREETVGSNSQLELAIGCYVVLSVADSGEGMDAPTLARATEPFFTTKPVGKGTGLGLSMAYGLAKQSGGRLFLHSAAGRGTTAELWLPRAEGIATLPALPADDAAEPAGRLHVILLIDDDALVLTSTAAILEELGHVVLQASSGGEALEIVLAGTQIDLAITDYSMPGMSGARVAEGLQRLRPGLPVLLATGHSDPQLASGLTRLPKPFGRKELIQAIESCASLSSRAGRA